MSLEELRNKINELDAQLVKLLNERARVVVEIGKLKNKTGKAVYAPDREKEVFARIAKANEGPLPDKSLVAIWRELMSGSFVLERPLRIGYLGPGGSFTHTAAMLKFGQSVEYEPLVDIRSIFDEVEADLRDREKVGIQTYGKSLYKGDPIDSLQYAYEEVLDLAIYIKKEILERDDKKAQT